MIDLDRVERLLHLVDRVVNGAPPAKRRRAPSKQKPERKPRVVKGKVIS